ncbi:MAG TPA: hypothetical protein VGS98_02060 [Thermoanaerobaculia bacterium]|nr:hypothetical protein [Thermoanaerobaculia bacterium]
MLPVTVVRKAALVACLMLLGAPAARATATDTSVTIDFERFPGPDGMLGTGDDTFPACDTNGICELLVSQFAGMGITFTSGLLLQSGLFPASSSSNHYVSSSPPDATFSIPVTGISITSYSFWTATLYALDEADNVIASNTLTNPNPGSSFFLGTLSVSTSISIRRFTVLSAGCQIGERCDQILNLDDLVLTLSPSVTGVAIDIKPGGFPNSINPRSHGRIPVAILTTDSFDATTVDPTTVRFGATGTEAAPIRWALEDGDGDGDTDLILYFSTEATGIECGDTNASLTGETVGGQEIEGLDSVNTVGCR